MGRRETRGFASPTGISILLLGMLLLAEASPVLPQIYKWRDKDGSIRFSDTPPPPGTAAETLKMKPASKEKGEPPPGEARKRPYGDIQAIIYVTDWCPYCRKAREYLNSLGVKLTEYDVERDKAKEAERLRKAGGGSGVPVIDVEGIIIRGFNPDIIKAAVEKRRNL